jgi:hypothetical protein
MYRTPQEAGAPTAPPDQVNAHYLGHVMSVAETHTVEASEDILTGNGIKLIARGGRINAATAEELPDRLPFVAHLCSKGGTNGSTGGSRRVVDRLRRMEIGPPMQSLLTDPRRASPAAP